MMEDEHTRNMELLKINVQIYIHAIGHSIGSFIAKFYVKYGIDDSVTLAQELLITEVYGRPLG